MNKLTRIQKALVFIICLLILALVGVFIKSYTFPNNPMKELRVNERIDVDGNKISNGQPKRADGTPIR